MMLTRIISLLEMKLCRNSSGDMDACFFLLGASNHRTSQCGSCVNIFSRGAAMAVIISQLNMKSSQKTCVI
jgi:hypothetical protein